MKVVESTSNQKLSFISICWHGVSNQAANILRELENINLHTRQYFNKNQLIIIVLQVACWPVPYSLASLSTRFLSRTSFVALWTSSWHMGSMSLITATVKIAAWLLLKCACNSTSWTAFFAYTSLFQTSIVSAYNTKLKLKK